jgi:hypothetical protein
VLDKKVFLFIVDFVLPTAKLTKVFKVVGLISGGTKYNKRFGIIEIYEVAKSELTMAFPGNRKAKVETA